jgi:hypothetical protein
MLNTREFPEKAGRIYPPLAIIEYGQATQEDLKAGKEFEFEFSINYEMEMKESKKDIEVIFFSCPCFFFLQSSNQNLNFLK